LEDKFFEICYNNYKSEQSNRESWENLAERLGYKSGEILRCAFKRDRVRRGLPAKGQERCGDGEEKVVRKSPKILVFDIETSYIEIASWGINKQYINKKQILNDWFMLSYAAKWLYDEEIYSGVLTPKESIKKDDKRLCLELFDLLDSCDIAVSYNGNSFDIPKINTRMIINKIQPPTPYKSIDIFQTVSKRFSFTSKSIDYVNMSLGLERKMENSGMDLWIRAVAGEADALKEMSLYNIQDVVALENQYLEVLPWILHHPNIGMWHNSDESICGFCGSKNLNYVDKPYSSITGLYRQFRCNDCHAIGRTQENILSKDKRKSLNRNV
jgi:DNA polymerase elongation subunit (family B)